MFSSTLLVKPAEAQLSKLLQENVKTQVKPKIEKVSIIFFKGIIFYKKYFCQIPDIRIQKGILKF